jgi:hypothetical protein
MPDILEHVIVKLLGIVNGDLSRNTKMANDVSSEKLLNGHGAYVGDWLRLNPLCLIYSNATMVKV